MTVKGGYDGIYEWVCGHLAKAADLAERAPRLGLALDEGGRVRVDFFGRQYLVDQGGVTAADGLPAQVNHLSLVGHYALSEGRGEPSGEFVTLPRLSSVLEDGGGADCSSGSKTLDRTFGQDLDVLRRKVERLGGVEVPDEPSGGLAWVFHPFPKVPLKLVHHPADDEFGADYKLLFDKSSTAFMAFEALGFLYGVFFHEMSRRP